MSFELWECGIIRTRDVKDKDRTVVTSWKQMSTSIGGCCGADFNNWARQQGSMLRTFNLFTEKDLYSNFCETEPKGHREYFEINTSYGVLYLVTQKHKGQK